jgi:PilZ domain
LQQLSDILVTHATPTGDYRIVCPGCNLSQPGNINEWPPEFVQPFDFVCACSRLFHVLVNVRSNHRKSCRLTGEYKLMQHGRQIEGVCSFLDVSKAGARVEASHLTNVEIGAVVRLMVTFADTSRSPILLSGKIRWVTTQPKRATMGIQFEHLEPHSQQTLGFYLL